MDIVTQGLLGGVLAQSVAGKDEKKLATVAGIVSGLLADADILIRSASDPLLTLEYHRHFTHALIFIPLGALIAVLLLWPFMRGRLSFSRLYLFCIAGFSLSGLLDACTSYGTHLFWPFSEERVALNVISIVDPVFSLCLLAGLVLGLRWPLKQVSVISLLLCACYLSFASLQLQTATAIARSVMNERNHVALAHVVKPTLGNILLWRSVYMTESSIYVDAVRVGLFGGKLVYEGESVPRFDFDTDVGPVDSSSMLFEDVSRFHEFSSGFIALDPTQNNVIGDVRYSMLPTRSKPLWGIVFDTTTPDKHVEYRFFRQSDKGSRKLFLTMLMGKPEQ